MDNLMTVKMPPEAAILVRLAISVNTVVRIAFRDYQPNDDSSKGLVFC